MLIDVATLSRHVGDPSWVIFDCRHDLMDFAKGAQTYRAGHLPGAHFAPVETVLAGEKTGANGRHPLPDAAQLAAFFNRHGVTPQTQLVAYDDVGGQYAARLWWLARWIGLTQVSILDGGWARWLASGGATETAIPAERGGGTIIARPEAALAATVAEVFDAIRTDRAVVIDARAPERYRGESESIDRRAGHIPTARNRFFKTNLRADLTLRPAAELRAEFEALLAGRRPAEVIHQCGSGITACANLFAMEYAGLAGSKLYVGSWSEWIADPTRPIAVGAAPGSVA